MSVRAAGSNGAWRIWLAGCGALLGFVAPVQASSRALPEPVYSGPLYDGAAAGSENWKFDRFVTGERGRESVYNTREPRIAVYRPAPGKANGTAVVLLPGGGLRVLGLGDETDGEIAAFLDHGVTVLLLEYRTLQIDPQRLAQPAPPPPGGAAAAVKFPKLEIRNGNANPSPDDPALSEVLRLATADGQAALQLADRKAGEWHLDRSRIGMIGTSAGGGVAFGALMAEGPPETKPDFIVSIFGPALQDVAAGENAPPLFLVTEADHGPVTDGLIALFSIWKTAGQKAELHVYEVPNFSMTVDLWGNRLFDWMQERGIVPAVGSR